MSAREDLYAALMKGGPHTPDRSERASALLDAYTHEVAEKLRSYLLPEEDSPHVPHNRTVRNLAELIDPEVTSNG